MGEPIHYKYIGLPLNNALRQQQNCISFRYILCVCCLTWLLLLPIGISNIPKQHNSSCVVPAPSQGQQGWCCQKTPECSFKCLHLCTFPDVEASDNSKRRKHIGKQLIFTWSIRAPPLSQLPPPDACSSFVCVGALKVFWLPPTIQRHEC